MCEQQRFWQDCMHTKSRLSIDWKNMPYVRQFLCMCERIEGSGETARVLRCVRAMTDRICCLSQRTRCLFLLHLLKFDLASRCSRQLPCSLTGPVPYFREDWSWNNFYGHSPPFRWIIQEGLLSVTSESMCTKNWLTACSSLPRKKCG